MLVGKTKMMLRRCCYFQITTLCNECIGLASELVEEEDEEHISTLTWLMRLGIKPKDIRKIVKK